MDTLPPLFKGNIYLVGMMGAGKTSVGKLLANRLGKRFFDSDQQIERHTGVPISLIFEIEGEAGFRRREAEIIRELVALENIVLATGGGAVLHPETRQRLNRTGTVVYLRSTPHRLWQRTRHDRQRPLLQAPDPQKKIADLLAAREPLYQDVAHVIVDTDSQSLGQLIRRLLPELRQACAETR